MAEIKDPAYLFVPPELNHPAAGKTIEVEMSEFKSNAKKWKEMGIRPATGSELAPLQKREERRIAEDSPGTAAALAGLRGATFGISDYALQKSGIAEGDSLEQLREANPYISAGSELLGGLVTGGAALKGGMHLARGASTLLRRQMIGGALSSAGAGAGMTVSDASRKGLDPELGDVILGAGMGALTGVALPVVGRGLQEFGGSTLRGALRGSSLVGKLASEAGEGISGALRHIPDGAKGLVDVAFSAIGAPGLRPLASIAAPRLQRIGGIIGDMSDKALQSAEVRKQLAGMARQLRDKNAGLSAKDAKALASKILERGNKLQPNPLGGTAQAFKGAPPHVPDRVEFEKGMRKLAELESSAENPFTGRSREEIVELLKRQKEHNAAKAAQDARALLLTGR